MIEEALVAHLAADTGVLSLLAAGNSARVRIFPLVIPQKVKGVEQLPCVVYGVVGEERSKTYCGSVRMMRSTVSLDSYATTLLVARRLSIAIRESILDFRGLMGGKVHVSDVSHAGSISIPDMDPGLMRVADTYSIWHVEE